ncbi:MAG: abortive infection system antitoxin AbiGi family protein [Verrucomicrobia bacterium]|nr:abortive infection system antitoxin AbiGi family protein [Verrucomicrobiota bacterium]
MKNSKTNNQAVTRPTPRSSNCLFHYTRELRILYKILQQGFRHSLSDEESLPNYIRPWQRNFISCFCDLLPKDADDHRKLYGNLALGLTKSWGIDRKITPVRYIHKKSVGAGKTYQYLKNLYRSSVALVDKHVPALMNDGKIENKQGVRDPQLVMSYLLFSLLFDDGFVPDGDLETAMANNPAVKAEIIRRSTEYSGLINSTPDDARSLYFCKCVSTLVRRIYGLHSELEERDVLMRALEEKDRVLYDEKEWRSMGRIPAKDDFSHLIDLAKAWKRGYLPPSSNLKFEAKDLEYIVVTHERQKTHVLKFLRNNHCLIKEADAYDKLVTFEKLKSRSSASSGTISSLDQPA